VIIVVISLFIKTFIVLIFISFYHYMAFLYQLLIV